MVKQNLPNSNTGTNYTSEMSQYNYLYNLRPRSTTGDISFTSSTSGVSYSTSTYKSGIFASQGQDGMLAILADVLSPYLITADNYNDINGSVALSMTSTQDANSRTTNQTYKRASNNSTIKIYDYSNFDANNKPQTIRIRIYEPDGTTLNTDKTATLTYSSDGSEILSYSEVSNI